MAVKTGLRGAARGLGHWQRNGCERGASVLDSSARLRAGPKRLRELPPLLEFATRYDVHCAVSLQGPPAACMTFSALSSGSAPNA
jgi:hypothetical protein